MSQILIQSCSNFMKSQKNNYEKITKIFPSFDMKLKLRQLCTIDIKQGILDQKINVKKISF